MKHEGPDSMRQVLKNTRVRICL